MKFGLVKSALVTILALAGGFAQAADGIYWGAQLSKVTYKESGFPDFSPVALSGLIGKSFGNNLSGEVRLGTGLAPSSKAIGGVNADLEVTHLFGFYGRASLPVAEGISIYGLLGYTQGKLKALIPGVSATGSDSSVSYGLGAEFPLDKSTSVGLEYASLIRGKDFDLNSMGIMIKLKF